MPCQLSTPPDIVAHDINLDWRFLIESVVQTSLQLKLGV